MEILGATAASLQLAEQTLTIAQFLCDSISKLRNAADIQEKRLERVVRLTALLHAIICHKAFQTHLVEEELSHCLRDVSRLRDIIVKLDTPPTASKWKRYPKRLFGLFKDDEINDCFVVLERDMGSLAIALQNADAQLLSDIGIELTSMHGHVISMSIAVEKIADGVEKASGAVPQVLERLDNLDMALSRLNVSEEARPLKFINFPYHRVKDFVGQANILVAMRRCLSDEAHDSGPRCIILRGLLGQGKSSLAIEYCRQTLEQPYQTILWIDASSQSSIDYHMTVCAEQILGPHDSMPSTSEGKAFVIFQKLAVGKMPWLVVFDNFDGPRSVPKFHKYLPSSPNASIIITTRRQDVVNLISHETSIELGAMNEDDALELLLQTSKTTFTKQQDHKSLAAAREIVEALWKNPLAIVQAGSYINRSRLGFAAFSNLREDRARLLLAKPSTIEYFNTQEGAEIPIVITLLTAWDLTLSQLENEAGGGPKAHKDDLLNLFAYIPSRSFSESYLASFCSVMEPWGTSDDMAKEPGSFLASCLQAWDSRAFSDILAEFYDLGLIQQYTIDKNGFYVGEIPDMVQDCVRLRLPYETRSKYERLFTDIILHSDESPRHPTGYGTNLEDSQDTVVHLIESWDMPPWEEQVVELVLNIWNSGDEYGFDFAKEYPSLSEVMEDLTSQTLSFRSSLKDTSSLDNLRSKIIGVAQLIPTGVDQEAIDNFILHLENESKGWSGFTETLLADVVKWLLPVIKVVGPLSPSFIDLIRFMGNILISRSRRQHAIQGFQLLKGAFIAIRSQESSSPVEVECLNALCEASHACGEYQTGELLARILISRYMSEDMGGRLPYAMLHLGISLYFVGDKDREAVNVLEEASNSFAMILGDTHLDKLRCDVRLAWALPWINEPRRALGVATKTLRTVREQYESIDSYPTQWIQWQCLGVQAFCQNRIGQSSQAIQSKREELACRRRSDRDKGDYYEELSRFAKMLLDVNRLQEAKTAVEEAICGLLRLGYRECDELMTYAYGVRRAIDNH
ncbi:lysophospholipase [Fusarium pseudocircinatum]|uniref:Lysophospholipase n=1 Tax=Fusarium pseudocircinatum TaxID=56676 RepID=A0A8H5KV52_9HYPO|nr:lysophospholipase [Fusarium pseudocircinatum]